VNKKLLVVLFSNYGAVISLGFYIPIFALYVVKLGGSVRQAGLSTAIYYVLGGVLMLLFRMLTNNKRARPGYYLVGNALEAVAALLFIMVTSVPQLYVVQLVHALATAMRVPSQRALYGQYEDKGKEGSQWSIMEGGNYIIIGLSAAAGGMVASVLSFRIVFLVVAGVQIITTLYSLRLYKRPARKGKKATALFSPQFSSTK